METQEHLHKQLGSLNDLRSVVKTMKALSAASIRQYEQAVDALTGYAQTVQRGLSVALRATTHPTSETQSSARQGSLVAIVFGSDHGLCGRFNEEIAEYAITSMSSLSVDPADRLILAVGSRVATSLELKGQVIAERLPVPGSASQITNLVQQTLLKLDEWRLHTEIDAVHLLYNSHTNGQSHRPANRQLLPVDLALLRSLPEERWPTRSLPTFTMDRDQLVSRLLHQHLFVSIARACAESQSSEHASRLSAMQSAQRNLDERLQEVTALFRRSRQSVITAELLDVVSGFEAITTMQNSRG